MNIASLLRYVRLNLFPLFIGHTDDNDDNDDGNDDDNDDDYNVNDININDNDVNDNNDDTIITIHDDVWIGANSVVLPGITIGAGAVVAAGSIVTKDVEENAIVAGNPARLIRFRD